MSALPSGAFVAFEAAGGHERLLIETFKAAGVSHARVNPRKAREFARATGRLAKTDKVDARVLAQIGASIDLRPLWSVEAERQRPAGWLVAAPPSLQPYRRREAAPGGGRYAFVRRKLKAHVAPLERRRIALAKEIEAQKQSHEALEGLGTARAHRARYRPRPRGAILIVRLPELGLIDPHAIASLCGLRHWRGTQAMPADEGMCGADGPACVAACAADAGITCALPMARSVFPHPALSTAPGNAPESGGERIGIGEGTLTRVSVRPAEHQWW
ncbi:MAG: transposase [Hyphomonadaceae bacterium]